MSKLTEEVRHKLNHLEESGGYRADGRAASIYAEPQDDFQIFIDVRRLCDEVEQLEKQIEDSDYNCRDCWN